MLNIDLLPELPDAICHGVSISHRALPQEPVPLDALPAEPVPWEPDPWETHCLDDVADDGGDGVTDQRRQLCFETCELSKEELEAASLDNLVHLGVRKRGGRHWTCNQGQLIAA